MGIDLVSVLIGAAGGAAVMFAYDKGYISIPTNLFPCPSGTVKDAAGNCVAVPVCGTGTHLDTATNTCVANTTAYGRASYYGRRRW